MNEDDDATEFGPPDVGEELADAPDPAFGETDEDDDETPDDDEPDEEPVAAGSS